MGLKSRVLKVIGLCFERAQMLLLEWRQGKQPTTYSMETDLKSIWEHSGEVICTSLSASQRGSIHGDIPHREQRNWQMPFPSLVPQHNHRTICRNQCSADTGWLVCLYQTSPHPLQWKCLPSHDCISPSMAGPIPQINPNPYPHHVSWPRNFAGHQFWQWWWQMSFH